MRLTSTLIAREMVHLIAARLESDMQDMGAELPRKIRKSQFLTDVRIPNRDLEKKTLDDVSSEYLEKRAKAIAKRVNQAGARRSWQLPFPDGVGACRYCYQGLNLRAIWVDEEAIGLIVRPVRTMFRFDVLVAP